MKKLAGEPVIEDHNAGVGCGAAVNHLTHGILGLEHLIGRNAIRIQSQGAEAGALGVHRVAELLQILQRMRHP